MKEKMQDKQGILNMHKLNELGPVKLCKKLEELFKGDYLYRTNDGRILDFATGTEHPAPKKKFEIQSSLYETKQPSNTRYYGKVQVTQYPTALAHINRNTKKKKQKRR